MTDEFNQNLYSKLATELGHSEVAALEATKIVFAKMEIVPRMNAATPVLLKNVLMRKAAAQRLVWPHRIVNSHIFLSFSCSVQKLIRTLFPLRSCSTTLYHRTGR